MDGLRRMDSVETGRVEIPAELKRGRYGADE